MLILKNNNLRNIYQLKIMLKLKNNRSYEIMSNTINDN